MTAVVEASCVLGVVSGSQRMYCCRVATGRVNLFATCLVDLFYPQIAERLVSLLERLGCEVDFPDNQTCCGQPAANAGYPGESRRSAERFVEIFSATQGPIVAPFGSCVHTVRRQYPELLGDKSASLREVQSLAKRTFDFCTFIVDELGVDRVGGYWEGPNRLRAVYHDECHMRRGLGVFEQPRRLLRGVSNVDVVACEGEELCCGFGGSFSMKLPELSQAMADQKLDSFSDARAHAVVTTDPGCIMHLEGRARRRDMSIEVMHLLELLEPKPRFESAEGS